MSLIDINSKPGQRKAINETTFAAIAGIVHAECGIVLTESKRNLLVSRLTPRLRELRLTNFADYRKRLQGPEAAAERNRLVSLVTTNVTHFLREKHHFDSLRDIVFPPLVKRARTGGKVRIWSAGCSTGEEPYSIAMCLLDQLRDAPEHDIRIIGTDIDPSVINAARIGEYTELSKSRLPPLWQERYVAPAPGPSGRYRLKDSPRALVSFAKLNLLADWPIRSPLDVIFCRNVMIYFDDATERKLLSRFTDHLAPGGHLFLGHSERAGSNAMARLTAVGVTHYRRHA